MHKIITKSDRSSQAIRNIKITLVKKCEIILRSMIDSRGSHRYVHAYAAGSINGLLCSSHCSGLRHPLLHHLPCHCSNDSRIHLLLYTFCHRSSHVFVKIHRTIRAQPFRGEEGAYGPVPEPSYGMVAFKVKFLSEGVLQFLLSEM